jgi:CBS-domain-containing membrane protein
LAVLNAWQAPSVLASHQRTPVRVWAAVIAAALTVLILLLLRASHPPAGATTLLVALGALQTKTDAFNVGVLIIAAAGEVLRLIRLGKMRSNRS